MRKLYLLFILLAGCFFGASGQTYLQPNEYQQRLNNGLHLFYSQVNGAKEYEVMLAYRFGAMAEDSVTDGLAYVCHNVFLSGLQENLKKIESAISIDGRFGHEVCTYQFKVTQARFDKAMEAISTYYANEPDSTAFATAIYQNATLTGIVQHTVMYPAEQELIKRHWGSRNAAFSIYGPVPQVNSSTIAMARKMYRSAYCIEFALMVFSGPDHFRDSWKKVQDLLGYISTCRGELYNTKMADLFPRPKFSSQVVYNVGSATTTRYQKMFQGPYVSFDPEGTIAAQLLKMLFTQAPRLAKIADSLGIATLRLAYDPMKFASGLTWHIIPKTDSLHTAYGNFDSLMGLLATKHIIPDSEIETAKANMLKQFETIRNHPSKKMYLIAQYWTQGILPWLSDYPKMIKAVNHEKLSEVIQRYMSHQKYTTLLLLNDSDSLSYDINRFTTTYTHIKNISFQFQKNTATFSTPVGDSILNTLGQTLLINEDVIVSLNSLAYKSELLNVSDDSLAVELNKYQGFYLYPKNLYGKKTFRLDIYRTAKLIVALMKMGILPQQLKGTGTLLKEDEGAEKYETTVTPAY
ncbi:hypothetical protein BH09BAC1_BH09BAC1_16980 [soil metagenome]